MHKLLLLLSLTSAKVMIFEPRSLMDSLGENGAIDYVVSTFGELLYSEHVIVQLVSPPASNEHGCNPLTTPKEYINKRFAWILKRGVCTYSKKAYEAQKTGAYTIFVYHNDPSVAIRHLIPISDSVCKLTRQQHSNSCYSILEF